MDFGLCLKGQVAQGSQWSSPTLSIVPDIKVDGNGVSNSSHYMQISEDEIFTAGILEVYFLLTPLVLWMMKLRPRAVVLCAQ